MPKRLSRIEFYHLHGHVAGGPLDYRDLLRALQSLRGYDLKEGTHHAAVGTAAFNSRAGQLFLVVYTGYSERSSLFFDLTTTEELTESTLPGRFQARKTYAMIDAGARLLAIEARRGYLGPSSLARLIEEYVRTSESSGFRTLELSFSPVVDEAFLDRLNEFERIKSATITIVRPNVDWTDQHDKLTEIAQASDAKSLGIEANSKRGKSLSTSDGIIHFIKSGAARARSLFQKIKIIGSLGGDSGLIILDLSKHIKYASLPIEVSPHTGQTNDSDARSKLSKLLRDARQG